MKRYSLPIASLLFVVNLLIASCKKEIAVPNEIDRDLFASWKWIKTDGGLNGGINTPALAGFEEFIEYRSKGEFYRYKGTQKTESLKFSIIQGQSIFTGQTVDLLTYKKAGLLNRQNQNDFIKQSFIFRADTLILQEETTAGFKIYYVKK